MYVHHNGRPTAPHFDAMRSDPFRDRSPAAEAHRMTTSPATATLPKPIAVVLEHHGELQRAYVARRVAQDKTQSFVGALSDVLSAAEVAELSRLISGSYDENYDAARGAQLGQLLLDDLEQAYDDLRRTRSRTRRWHGLDAPAVVDALATDIELATLFTQALDERNETTAAALVTGAVRVVVEKASASRNAPDTRRGLVAAATAFRRYATDGAGASPQAALLDGPRSEPALTDALLATWCDALCTGVNAAL
jgi:hypothetical protein